MQKILPKTQLNNFLESLMKNYDIIAPVKQDNTRFAVIKNSKQIYLDKITLIPPKQLFIPENETLLKFKDNKIMPDKPTKSKKKIIFGLRKCDLNALLVTDKVMKDPLYIQKRKNTILIGVNCNSENTDKYCFCNSMELEDYYDLFFYLDKNKYYISVSSKVGEQLVKHLPKNNSEDIIKKIKNSKTLKNKDIADQYQNKIWQTDAEKCLSCSACTIYCPTCNCFNIEDFKKLNQNSGKRIRNQASCQLKSFTQVAGGKSFRDSRLSRFKHFVYHKISYFKKTHGKYMCVGCGRCLRVCPTKIDWVNTINLLKDMGDMKI